MYGIEPRYNECFHITNIIRHRYNELQCQHATEDKRWTDQQSTNPPLVFMVSQVWKSENSCVPSRQRRTHFWGCKPKDRGNLQWKNSFFKHKLLLVSGFSASTIFCLVLLCRDSYIWRLSKCMSVCSRRISLIWILRMENNIWNSS